MPPATSARSRLENNRHVIRIEAEDGKIYEFAVTTEVAYRLYCDLGAQFAWSDDRSPDED